HFHAGASDAFTDAEGLSGNNVHALFEDREGSIWVATGSGLDRFRNVAFPSLSVRQGLSSDSILSVLPAADVSVWMATLDALNRWERAHLITYGAQSRPTPPTVREVVASGFPERGYAMFEDSRGRVWISDRHGAGYMNGDRYVPVPNVPGDQVYAMVENPP